MKTGKSGWCGIILAVVLTLPAWGKGTPLTPAETELARYLTAESANPATIASFDHIARVWSILDWDGSYLRKTEGSKEKPAIPLAGDRPLRVFVVNTNPLIYTADRSATASTTIEALDNLKTLATSLGGILGTTLSIDAQRNALATLATPAARMALKTSPGALSAIASNFLDQLDATAKTIIQTPLTDLAASSRKLKGSLDAIPQDQLLAWLQSVESGVPLASRLPAPQKVDLTALGNDFQDVARKRIALKGLQLPCVQTVTVVADLVLTERTPLVGFGAAKALDDFERTARQVPGNMGQDQCSPSLQQATLDLVAWLINNPPTPSGPTTPDESEALQKLTEGMEPYLKLAQQVSDADAQAAELAKKQPAAILSASQVNRFLQRLADSTAAGTCANCDPATGVLEIPRSSFKGSDLSWAEVRTDTVSVTIDEGLKDKLTLTHPASAEGSFSAHRKWTDGLEADFGLTKTNLYSSTFAAEEVKDDPDFKSRVQETDRTTRSGKAALFAAYRVPLGLGFAVGPQVGVGVDTDAAALFYGISLRWRFLSVGYGKTRQKVKELNGQEIGQGLRDGETVKTRDTFKTESYLSLTITIKNLDFFKPKS